VCVFMCVWVALAQMERKRDEAIVDTAGRGMEKVGSGASMGEAKQICFGTHMFVLYEERKHTITKQKKYP